MKNATNCGSVLILAIWTLLFLSSLAVATRSYVLGHLQLVEHLRDREQRYYLAKAGVETAMAVAGQDTNAWDALTEPWSSEEALFKDVCLGIGRFEVVCRPAGEDRGTRPGLLDEESKININKAHVTTLKAFLVRVAGMDSLTANRIAASISDWRDEDSQARTEGAEDDYYHRLPVPYECHDGVFDSLDELALVRGVAGEVFERIIPYLTVYGSGRVNINTAAEVVLAGLLDTVLPGDPTVVDGLVGKVAEFRAEGGVFHSSARARLVADLARYRRLARQEENALSRLANSGLIDVRSTHMRGEAVGWTDSRDAGASRIEFIFDRRTGTVRYWHED